MKTIFVLMISILSSSLFAQTWYFNTLNMNMNKAGGITRHNLTAGEHKFKYADANCVVSALKPGLSTQRNLKCDLGTHTVEIQVLCSGQGMTNLDITPKGKDTERIVMLCDQ